MGGDREPLEVARLAQWLHQEHPSLKTAWYSGKAALPENFPIEHFQYIKIGPYLSEQGPLNVRTTNQRLYRIEPDGSMSDITAVFWKK
jgi:anaerobic ribonucleoside-triphosphate reductase activating protein